MAFFRYPKAQNGERDLQIALGSTSREICHSLYSYLKTYFLISTLFIFVKHRIFFYSFETLDVGGREANSF